MEHTQRESPLGSPNSATGTTHIGARLRHLARPEVLVLVCACFFREHEVVRDVVGAHPLRGLTDHQQCLGLCAPLVLVW